MGMYRQSVPEFSACRGVQMRFLQMTLRTLAAALALPLLCLPAFSQANNGRILGNVLDQSGGSVAARW